MGGHRVENDGSMDQRRRDNEGDGGATNHGGEVQPDQGQLHHRRGRRAPQARVPEPLGQQDPLPGAAAADQPEPHARRLQAVLRQDIELLRYILTLQDKEYLPLKVIKKRIEGGAPRLPAGDSAGDLSRVLEDRTYTREELADTLETEMRFVEELISVGVIGSSGELTQRDAEIARMAMEMAKYSIQPRHLRGIMAAVDREAALFKQVVNPELGAATTAALARR